MIEFIRIFLICCVHLVLVFQTAFAQKSDSTIKRNVAIMASCSMLEGNGFRAELPTFYYGTRKHAFSIAPACNFTSDNNSYGGMNVSYFYFIEPSFRDITFYLLYNAGYYFRNNGPITHIIGLGTQIDVGKRAFIHHSVGFGINQSTTDFSSLGPAGQLKLSFGFYLREIPVQHIHDEWEGGQRH